MKRYLLLLAVTSCLATTGFAQKEKEEEHEKTIAPPAAAKAAFTKAYTGASKVKWSKEKSGYEVNFIQGGKEMSAVYDAKGTLMETEVDMKVSELPVAATDYIKQHYKGAAIKEAAKITKANGEVNYEAEVNKKDIIFDANGKFLKEEKDED